MLILSLKSPLGKVNKVCMYVCLAKIRHTARLYSLKLSVSADRGI